MNPVTPWAGCDECHQHQRAKEVLRTEVGVAEEDWVHWVIWGFSIIGGYHFGDPHNKDYSILGSILGSPIWGNYHISLCRGYVGVRVQGLGFRDLELGFRA